MANYKHSADVEEDIRRLYRHGIQNFGLVQADSYFDGLFARFDQLAEEPLLYRAVDEIRAGYRRSVYGVHSIYYRVLDNHVEIMRILGREDPSVRL